MKKILNKEKNKSCSNQVLNALGALSIKCSALLSYLFQYLLLRPLLRFIIGVRYNNKVALSKKKQFIIVANHNSHLDALSIRAALPKHQLHNTLTVAAGDYFGKNRVVTKLLKICLNTLLINRKRIANEPSSIEKMDDLIKQGQSLILFPEGSRGQPGVLTDFKKGIAVLLKRNPNLHYIPAYLNGFGRVLPKNSPLLLPLVSKVYFGQPMQASSDNIEVILAQIETAILNLKPATEADLNQFVAL